MSKQKPLFHTFELDGRQITLCVKTIGHYLDLETPNIIEPEVTACQVAVGYSVKVKEDTFNQELAERISSGRADSNKARLVDDIIGVNYITTKVFKSIAEVWERRITNNPSKYIKGIKIKQDESKK